MKYKKMMVLSVAIFLLGACNFEDKTQNNNEAIESFVTLSPEQPVTPSVEVTTNVQPTLEVTVTPEPTVEVTDDPDIEATSTPAAVTEIELMNPLEAAFWCKLYENDTEELLTSMDIALINRKNFETEGTDLVDLSAWERNDATDVVRMIESYTFPNKRYYDNMAVTEHIKSEILNNRNLEALKDTEHIEPAYGILIQNADLRSFPAALPLTSGKNGRYDYLQETVLLLNEAVVVLHRSLDGKWCFVQAENYYGWISETSIAYCEREYMETWYDAMKDMENPDVLLVTKNVELDAEDGESQLRMGTRLKYEREDDGIFAVYLPVRAEDKSLRLKTFRISPEDAVYQYLHQGYLHYTRSNVIRLATALLDTPYAWGDALPYSTVYAYDSDIGMDCSSTIGAVYRCFGFVMPRNTGAQRNLVWPGEKVSGYSSSERRELLEQTDMGTLLYSPGHVMMFLGEYEGEYYVLHNTTTERLQDGTEETFYRCVITSMSLGEKGSTIFDDVLETKTPVKSQE